MPLQVSYVERLEAVIPAAVEFLSRDGDLFDRPRVVVPTPGARAWLLDRLARELGTSGPGRRDGIVANVDVAFPGTIAALLQPPPDAGNPDPWSLDRLTFAVLDVITGPDASSLGIPFDVGREPLLAARRIAGLFDSYHVRRPGMMLLWEKGRPALNPVATPRDPEGSGGELDAADRWQFETWRAVRHRIAAPSPPQRIGLGQRTDHARLLVVGLQSLSLQQITSLQALGTAGDVRVLLVHPAPTLRSRWAAHPRPESPGVPPPREPVELPDDLDPLVAAWLHGSRETQMLLASQGIHPEHDVPAAPASGGPEVLLHRMQRSIRSAERPAVGPHDLAHDRSFTVHGCHSLSRQAEVLHDAILHAFVDLPDLHPHEVVIVSPCLKRLAPHLEAVFDREVAGAEGRHAKLPLVVADRGLHEVSPAAELLVLLLDLVGSRCPVEAFRTLAGHELVRRHLGIDDEVVRCWDGLIERTKIHWGFDADHRRREGFPEPAAEAHTWRSGLERMLLGAVLPDAPPRAELGGAVPLADVPLDDLAAIAALARILDLVRGLDAAAAAPRPVAAWCDAIEEALAGLCGPEATELAEPLRLLRTIRDAASPTAVPFADVRGLLRTAVEAAGGRQPFRTGAITATSMVPLRDVPFRVVCVAGYDDGAVAVADPRGDDLVTRQGLAGDGDPRIDVRRTLLDYVLAAGDRLVVTCTGSDIRNNQPLPLVTPLAELVDFAVRHGATRPDGTARSAIEFVHPRHAVGRRNFRPGEVQPGLTWSHDAAALAAATGMGAEERRFASGGAVPQVPVVELSLLEDMVRQPLGLYLRRSLGVSTWQDGDEFPAATFPLALADREARQLTRELLDLLVASAAADGRVAAWLAAVRAACRVPFDRYGDQALREIEQLARGIHDGAAAAGLPLGGFDAVPVRMPLPDRLLTGTLPGVHRETRQLVDVRVTKADRSSWGLPLHVAGLRLLVAEAAGLGLDRAVVVGRHDKWQVDATTPAMIARTVTLADGVRGRAAATARIAALCDLVPLALAAPCGRFGKTWEKLAAGDEAARTEFERHIGWRFTGTDEELVYGPQPRFDDVLAVTAPERAFHLAFGRLLPLTGRYLLS